MRPLGYFGACYENALIKDIAEQYNELQDMDETDWSWLLGKIGAHYWMKWCEASPSTEAQEIRDRLKELPKNQLACLIQAIGNKGSATRPLGFYSCDYQIPLIEDVHDYFGDYLDNLNEVDQMWLLGMMGEYYFLNHQENQESDKATYVYSMLFQLDRYNCGALLHALSNR